MAVTDGYYVRLSPRDVETLLYVAAGLSNKEIAHLMHQHKNTIAKRLGRLSRHLRVQGRTAIVIAALKEQWFDLADIDLVYVAPR